MRSEVLPSQILKPEPRSDSTYFVFDPAFQYPAIQSFNPTHGFLRRELLGRLPMGRIGRRPLKFRQFHTCFTIVSSQLTKFTFVILTNGTQTNAEGALGLY